MGYEEPPPLFDICLDRHNAVFHAAHGRDDGYHLGGVEGVEFHVIEHSGLLADGGDIVLGVVLDGWRIAADHLPERPVAVFAVGVQQHEHGTVAPCHRLKCFECPVAGGLDLAEIGGFRQANVARIAVA